MVTVSHEIPIFFLFALQFLISIQMAQSPHASLSNKKRSIRFASEIFLLKHNEYFDVVRLETEVRVRSTKHTSETNNEAPPVRMGCFIGKAQDSVTPREMRSREECKACWLIARGKPLARRRKIVKSYVSQGFWSLKSNNGEPCLEQKTPHTQSQQLNFFSLIS